MSHILGIIGSRLFRLGRNASIFSGAGKLSFTLSVPSLSTIVILPGIRHLLSLSYRKGVAVRVAFQYKLTSCSVVSFSNRRRRGLSIDPGILSGEHRCSQGRPRAASSQRKRVRSRRPPRNNGQQLHMSAMQLRPGVRWSSPCLIPLGPNCTGTKPELLFI